MDRLLEFKRAPVPSLVFWPGFDEQFREPVAPPEDPPWRQHLDARNILVYSGNIHDTNAAEVRSLFLAVQVLKRAGVSIRLLKTGWNHVHNQGWIREAVDSGAVADLGFLPRSELPALLSAEWRERRGRPFAQRVHKKISPRRWSKCASKNSRWTTR